MLVYYCTGLSYFHLQIGQLCVWKINRHWRAFYWITQNNSDKPHVPQQTLQQQLPEMIRSVCKCVCVHFPTDKYAASSLHKGQSKSKLNSSYKPKMMAELFMSVDRQ